jgi:hypothetical protein
MILHLWTQTSMKHDRKSARFTFFLPLLPLRSIGLISQFLDHLQTAGLFGRVISSSQGLYLNTEQHKHRKTHTHIKHPYPEWDSKPRSRLLSEQRHYMPWTARLPWPAVLHLPLRKS